MAFANERGVRESVCEVLATVKGVKVLRLNGRAFLQVAGEKELYEVAVSVPRTETQERVKAANTPQKNAAGRKPNNVGKDKVANVLDVKPRAPRAPRAPKSVPAVVAEPVTE